MKETREPESPLRGPNGDSICEAAVENAGICGLLVPGKAATGVITGSRGRDTDGKQDKMWVQDILSVDSIHMYPHGAICPWLSKTV